MTTKLEKFYREKEVLTKFIHICRTTLWRWVRNGTFPPPVKFGRMTAWRESDLLLWQQGLWKPAKNPPSSA